MLRALIVGLVAVLWLWPAAPLAQAQDDETKKLIVTLLEAKDSKQRRVALFKLEELGPRVTGIMQALTLALEKDPEAVVRREVGLVIGRWAAVDKDDAKDAIPALAFALKQDKDDKVREVAARALLQMVPHCKRALQQLVEALQDNHLPVRAAAAEAISALGDNSKTAVPQLIAYLKAAKDKKTDATARMYVVLALGRVGEEGAKGTAALVGVMSDTGEDGTVREAAAESLGRLGLNADNAGKPLADILLNPKNDLTLRLAAAKALQRVEGETKYVWPALKVGLADNDSTLRVQTVRAAAGYGRDEPEVIKTLAKLARTDDNVEVRLAAIQELAILGPVAELAVKDLQYIVEHDERETVRQLAEAALKKIKK